MSREKYTGIINEVFSSGALKKAVISKYRSKDDGALKSVLTPFLKGEEKLYQLETFYSDGKARHINMKKEEAAEYLLSAASICKQINIITTGGTLDVLVSSKGDIHISGKISNLSEAEAVLHDKKKN